MPASAYPTNGGPPDPTRQSRSCIPLRLPPAATGSTFPYKAKETCVSEELDSPTSAVTTAVIAAADQYHAGIVVDDPAATMAQLTELLGYEWCDPIGGTVTVGLP